MLIAFEGGEGSGKGTQIRILAERLKNLGFKVLIIFEPGGTELGQAVRNLLLNREDLKICFMAEALLFTASRAQQVVEVTNKALEEGYVVLSDRSFYSTYAYQGYGRGLDLKSLSLMTELAVGSTKPNLVFLLDVPPKIGLKRKKGQNEVNKLEKEDFKFHQRVRNGFLKLASKDKKVWRVFNSRNNIQKISEDVWNEVKKYLK